MMSKRVAAGVVLGALAALSGCGGGFFVDTKNGTTGVTSTGDYLYVVNQSTDTLSEFVVGSSALTLVSGSPIGLATGLAPAAVVVSRPNTFVYVSGSQAIRGYSIGTGGALTAATAAGATGTGNYVSMDTSPDGKWLLAMDSVSSTINVYGLNASTGALTLTQGYVYAVPQSGGTSVPRSVRISPNGAFVAAALGPGGDIVMNFNTATGTLSGGGQVNLGPGFTDNGAVFDPSSAYLYVARGVTVAGASSIVSYAVSSAGALTATATLATSGAAPYGLLVDLSGTYLYSANRGDNNISGYTLGSSGALTALGGSPYAGGSNAIALAEDNSKKYVIAAALGGASDLTLYSFDPYIGGRLNATAVYTSGSDPAGSIALATTH